MRKLIILSVMLCLFCSLYADDEAATQAKYIELRQQAIDAEETGEWEKAIDLHIQAADATPNGWVAAWRLNSAALVIIRTGEKAKGLVNDDDAKRALELLKRAEKLVDDGRDKGQASAIKVILKNKLHCERVLGKKPW